MTSSGRLNSSDATGRVAFADFLSPPNTDDALGVTVIMDKVLRQDNKVFLSFLDHVRNGTLNEDDVEFILSRCLEKMSDEERRAVNRGAINLCSTWNMTHQITYEYLQSFNIPITVIRPKL